MTLSTTLLLGENSDSQLAWILAVLKTAITPLVQVLVVLLEDSTVHKSMIAESLSKTQSAGFLPLQNLFKYNTLS